ncbi:MAG: CrcB family protein [Propioniciclava sp.]|uniref:fluoride efflux transporter FluC n=1 Tax=Propioniciclava sp. TaxID=2038686 RepID=UPI0039E4035E
MILFLTALAGGVGGALRFLVDTTVSRINQTRLPLGTIVVNATACLALGMLTGYGLGHLGADHLITVLGIGLLGGYSTFSTASVEGARLIREGRWSAALVHSGGMLALSLAASVLGLALGGTLR